MTRQPQTHTHTLPLHVGMSHLQDGSTFEINCETGIYDAEEVNDLALARKRNHS